MEEYFKKIGAQKHRVRDPLYGFIPLTPLELRIIDTPLFQRLRRVHQLALTKYVYPSAEHSRFVHSLGVMHCATLLLAGIMEHRETKLDREFNSKMIKTLRYAALLHDIGHLPFSHAVEKQWLQGLSHEDLSIYIIENYRPITDVINEDGVDCGDVASLLRKKPKVKLLLLHEIISGQLDADRADYLLRDSHCCGVRYGEYDFPRFMQIFAAREDDDNGLLTLCVDETDLPVAESILIARYHYNLQIPYHRTRTGYDFVLKKFAREYTKYDTVFSVENGKLMNVDFNKLELLDDGSLFHIVKEQYAQREEWSQYLLRQKHLCPILDTNNLALKQVSLFKQAVRRLRAESSLQEEQDFFVQEQKIDMLKRAVPSEEKTGTEELPAGTIRLLVREGNSRDKIPVDICERSWIFGRLREESHMIYRIYAKPENKTQLAEFINKIERELGSESI